MTHTIPRRLSTALLALAAAPLLAGCDLLGMVGIESPEKVEQARDADGRAIGGACRHAGRAIEDCYALNKKADRAAVFAGWREMNDYMRENKIEAVAPEIPAVPAKVAAKGEGEEDGHEPSAKPAKPGKGGKSHES